MSSAVLLVGAGGHAKAVVEAIEAGGGRVAAYIDPRPANWLAAPRFANDEDVRDGSLQVVIGIGGVTPAQLAHRLALLDTWRKRGFSAPSIVHPRAYVSAGASLESSVIVLAGAVVQPGVGIARGALVNTGAIVEHDSRVGAGTHIAPGGVVLADCTLGDCVMVGANAVVLPGCAAPDRSLIKAASVYRGAASGMEAAQ